jgi:predicted AAA+ superfamily ATPase
MTGYRSRDVAGLAEESIAAATVVAITGLRQSGKSTFL